ncbi:MAG TPA: type II toxin-antitoxin system RelE/ParE family toxin [Thermoplasmatales archaeon]|nr:type II toxin-antitoxin system RelE/ParE family toxin [Thermoplasmatales archaeon]
MDYKIEYKSSVIRDLKNLDRNAARRIIEHLEKNFSEGKEQGVPLSGQFKGLFRYRMGDYRVIYTKTRNGILVLRIARRSNIYK